MHTGDGNGTGLLIGGLVVLGAGALLLSNHHKPPARKQMASSEIVSIALTGTVVDESHHPISGAAVALYALKQTALTSIRQPARRRHGDPIVISSDYEPSAYVESDVNGKFSILTQVRQGVIVLAVSAGGYAVTTVNEAVTSATTQIVREVTLQRPDPATTSQPYEQRGIYYVTDRKPETSAVRFDYKNEALHAAGVMVGRAVVSVAHSDALSKLFSRSTYAQVSRLAFGQAVVDNVSRPTSLDAFCTPLLSEALRSRSRAIVIFIHGYNEDFDGGLRDAAQLQYESGSDAPIVAYSWPSAHDLYSYGADEESNRASESNFVAFAQALKQKTDAAGVKLIVVAHSMGNRIALRGMEDIPSFAEMAVMAAPDVYTKTMTNGLSSIRRGVNRLTIYASRRDQALLASQVFHQDYRIGLFENDPFIVTGMDTIDATAVDTSMLGHSYFIESTTVASDISRFLAGQSPAARPHLLEKNVDQYNYWAISP